MCAGNSVASPLKDTFQENELRPEFQMLNAGVEVVSLKKIGLQPLPELKAKIVVESNDNRVRMGIKYPGVWAKKQDGRTIPAGAMHENKVHKCNNIGTNGDGIHSS
jgi:hypothetical protein